VIPASLAFLLHIPYVRIDCDIYLPALDCLNYLGSRLADGAILVFDDWPRLRGYGEQRACEEWLPTVPHLEFEFLFYGAIGHFYTRVHPKKLPHCTNCLIPGLDWGFSSVLIQLLD
jgi:hypothetical protein